MAYGGGYAGGYGDTIAAPSGVFPTLIPEIAFSSGAGETGWLHFDDPTRGKLDTATFGPDDYFVDVAEWFRAGRVNRGTSRHDGVYGKAEAGRASFVLSNQDRRFDPTNLDGPYVAGGVTQIVPMRAFRLRVSWAGTVYDLFRGFADAWDVEYQFPNDATTTLRGTDGTKVVANYDGVAGGTVGTGEDTGARIARVLDNAGWPAADRDLDTGQTAVQGTDLSANAWSEIVLTADTEIGEVYFDAQGKLVFRRRHALLTDARSNTAQAVFGDAGGELPYRYLSVEYDDTQVANIVRISRIGGTQQVAEDAASIAKYMRRTWGRSDLLMQTDGEAADYAAYVLALQKDAELRVMSLTIDPMASDDLWPQVLGRELGDRITVRFTPPGGGDRIERDVIIRGITHDIGTRRWSTTWAFQDADVFAFLVFDNTALGRLDYNAFAN